jgi:hypothetical protein
VPNRSRRCGGAAELALTAVRATVERQKVVGCVNASTPVIALRVGVHTVLVDMRLVAVRDAHLAGLDRAAFAVDQSPGQLAQTLVVGILLQDIIRGEDLGADYNGAGLHSQTQRRVLLHHEVPVHLAPLGVLPRVVEDRRGPLPRAALGLDKRAVAAVLVHGAQADQRDSVHVHKNRWLQPFADRRSVERYRGGVEAAHGLQDKRHLQLARRFPGLVGNCQERFSVAAEVRHAVQDLCAFDRVEPDANVFREHAQADTCVCLNKHHSAQAGPDG